MGYLFLTHRQTASNILLISLPGSGITTILIPGFEQVTQAQPSSPHPQVLRKHVVFPAADFSGDKGSLNLTRPGYSAVIIEGDRKLLSCGMTGYDQHMYTHLVTYMFVETGGGGEWDRCGWVWVGGLVGGF